MEKAYTDVLKNVSEVNKQAIESMLRFNHIAMRAQGLLARQQFSAMENYLAAGTRHMDLIGKTQDPQELVKLATEINVDLGEKLMNLAQESMDIQTQARDELTSWFEDGVNAVQKQAEKQTETATKATKAAAKSAAKKAA